MVIIYSHSKSLIIFTYSVENLLRYYDYPESKPSLPWTCGVLSRTLSSLSTLSVMGWQWGRYPWKRFPYIEVSDVLCYKQIPIIYRTSLLQNSLKVIIKKPKLLASTVASSAIDYFRMFLKYLESPGVIWCKIFYFCHLLNFYHIPYFVHYIAIMCWWAHFLLEFWSFFLY